MVVGATNSSDRVGSEKQKVMQKRIKVKLFSKLQTIKEKPNGSFTVYLKSPPINGKANEELIKLLANKFNLPK